MALVPREQLLPIPFPHLFRPSLCNELRCVLIVGFKSTTALIRICLTWDAIEMSKHLSSTLLSPGLCETLIVSAFQLPGDWQSFHGGRKQGEKVE